MMEWIILGVLSVLGVVTFFMFYAIWKMFGGDR